MTILTEHEGVINLKGPQSEQSDSPASQMKFPIIYLLSELLEIEVSIGSIL
jgi:hypothetical protein